MKARVESGAIGNYHTYNHCPTITHLAFADDIVLFLNGSANSLTSLKDSLQLYQDASGQKINLEKSFFVVLKCYSQARQVVLELYLGMRRSSLPFKYLVLISIVPKIKRNTFTTFWKKNGCQTQLLELKVVVTWRSVSIDSLYAMITASLHNCSGNVPETDCSCY